MQKLAQLAIASMMAIVFGACSSDSQSPDSTTATSTAATSAAPTSTAPGSEPSDTSGVSDTDDRITAIVDFTIEQAQGGGTNLDRDCVAGIVDELGEADLDALAAAVENPDMGGPVLSEQGQALGDRLYADCVVGSDDQALIDEVITRILDESGDSVDEACIRENVPNLNDEQLRLLLETGPDSTGPESTDPALQTASIFLLDCVEIGSPTTG